MINSVTVKHLMGGLIGLWFGIFTIHHQTYISLFSSAVSYFLLFITPRKYLPLVSYIWGIGFLSAGHIWRLYTDYLGWTMDFSGIQMILTLKLITLATDYADGEAPAEVLEKYPYRKSMQLKEFPTPLEFFGYIYFFPGFLSGPAFNFREYKEFVEGTWFKNSKIPSSIYPTFLKFGSSVLLLVGVFASMTFPVTFTRQEEFYTTLTFLQRALYIWASTALSRFPYYFAWFLSEGSCILSGIGYNGTDPKTQQDKWDRATNCKIIGVELAQNFKGVTDSWNLRVDRWLKHYIYERVPAKYGVFLTFLNSAVWHGFYPGYYMSFLTASIFLPVARILRKKVRAHFVTKDSNGKEVALPSKIIYDAITLVGTSWSLNYIMSPFVILSWEHSWGAWKSVYFVGHWIALGAYLFAKFLPYPKGQREENSSKPKRH